MQQRFSKCVAAGLRCGLQAAAENKPVCGRRRCTCILCILCLLCLLYYTTTEALGGAAEACVLKWAPGVRSSSSSMAWSRSCKCWWHVLVWLLANGLLPWYMLALLMFCATPVSQACSSNRTVHQRVSTSTWQQAVDSSREAHRNDNATAGGGATHRESHCISRLEICSE